jgi:hypothetical protein
VSRIQGHATSRRTSKRIELALHAAARLATVQLTLLSVDVVGLDIGIIIVSLVDLVSDQQANASGLHALNLGVRKT